MSIPRRDSEECKGELCRLARHSALLTVSLTAVAFALACVAVPVAGPYCPHDEDCIPYPYVDRILERWPGDYLWMIAAVPQLFSYLVTVCLIGAWAREIRPIDSSLAADVGTVASVAFATMGVGILASNYYVQLTVIVPSILHDELGDGLALLTMYNGRGVFIALEEVGFVCLSVSLLVLSPLFQGMLHLLLRAQFALVIISFLYVAVRYGWERSYRFEVFVISIVWLSIIICGSMIAWAVQRDAAAVLYQGGETTHEDGNKKSK